MSYCVTDGDEPAKAPEAKIGPNGGSAKTSFRANGFGTLSGGTVCHSGGCQQGEGRLLHVIAKSAAVRHSRWH